MLKLLCYLLFIVKNAYTADPEDLKTGSVAIFTLDYPEDNIKSQEWRLFRKEGTLIGEDNFNLVSYDGDTKTFKIFVNALSRYLCAFGTNTITLCYVSKMLGYLSLETITTFKSDGRQHSMINTITVSDETNYDAYTDEFVKKHNLVFMPVPPQRYCDDVHFKFHHLDHKNILMTASLHRTNYHVMKWNKLPLDRLENQEKYKLKVTKDEFIVPKMQEDSHIPALILKIDGIKWLRTYPQIQYQDPVQMVCVTQKRVVMKVNYGNAHHLQLVMNLYGKDIVVMETLVHHSKIIIDDTYVSSARAENDEITVEFNRFIMVKFVLLGLYGYENKHVFFQSQVYDNMIELPNIATQRTQSRTDTFSGFMGVQTFNSKSLIGRFLTKEDASNREWQQEIDQLYLELAVEEEEIEPTVEEPPVEETVHIYGHHDDDYRPSKPDIYVPRDIRDWDDITGRRIPDIKKYDHNVPPNTPTRRGSGTAVGPISPIIPTSNDTIYIVAGVNSVIVIVIIIVVVGIKRRRKNTPNV